MQKALIYVNISYNGRIGETLLPRGHLIERSVIHILDDHVVVIDGHDDTHVPIRRRKSRTMVDDDGTRLRILPGRHALLLGILEPIFGISAPSDVFILRDETGTVPPDEITASFCDLEG